MLKTVIMCNGILYKYRAINDHDRNGTGSCFTRNLLIQGELYFPKFSQLNDPNEAIFDYSEDILIAVQDSELVHYPNRKDILMLPDGRHRLLVDGRTAANHVRRQIDRMYGVLCLTEDNKNSLMFDYYAGGHSGICIGFEWEKLGLIYKENRKHLQPTKINYCRRPPIINPSGGNNFDDVFFSKWKEYSHEKEYRLTYTPGIFANPTNVLSAIKEIIFGCAVSDDDRTLVKSWVNSSGLMVKYFDAHLKPKSYQLDLKII